MGRSFVRRGLTALGAAGVWSSAILLVVSFAFASKCVAEDIKNGGGGAGKRDQAAPGTKKQHGEPLIPDQELPWRHVKQQKCNVGMQSAYQKPMFKTNHVSATCGMYNEQLDVDFSGRPCCCSYCGQRDPFEQLCEIVKHVCTTVADCIQRHHGECQEDGGASGGIEGFHVFWILVVGGFTVAPFIVPVFALRAAEDIVLGLAG